jgi:hypothetical protein
MSGVIGATSPLGSVLGKIVFRVRRGKAALSSGCKGHPAIAPAESNRAGMTKCLKPSDSGHEIR